MSGLRARSLAVIVLVGLSSAVGASATLAASDVAVTQSYIQANYRLVQTAGSRIAIGEAALQNVLAQVRRECPQAAAHSPQDEESTQMSDEVIGTMVTSAMHTDLPSIHEYLAAAGRLRWSSRGLTSAVHSYVSKLKTVVSLPQPHLCADVRSWAATGFTKLPASTVTFVASFMPSWVALGELPGGLARFESPQERGLIRRSNERESQLTEFEAQAVETYALLMNALDVNP